MKTVSKWLLCLLLPVIAATALAADTFTDGKEYHTLGNPQPVAVPGKIEVVEMFWYGCPHCFHLEPYVQQWLKTKPGDVNFVRIPAVLGKGWELLAKAYYTAELLGVLDKVHSELFDEIHVRHDPIRDEKSLREFFVSHGVLPESFDKTFNSFAVTVKVNNARMMSRRYGISGVPTLIVDGKYSTSVGDAGSNEKVFKVVDYLIAKERKHMALSRAGATAPR
jgi:thiol:disulfide interchange protein DsbA